MSSRHDQDGTPPAGGTNGRACAHLCRDSGVESGDGALWRAPIDALAFQPPDHGGWCTVHRLAFRALLGRNGEPADCLAHFAAHRPAFERAAAAKIARRGLAAAANLHLTSRDVARAIAHLATDG